MAVLTGTVIADLEEASLVAEAFEPSRKWKGIDARGQNDLTLGSLLNIFRGADPYLDVRSDFKEIASKSDYQGP